LQCNADARHGPFRGDLDQLTIEAGAAQRNCERHAGNAAADDQDVLGRSHTA
jgi:hypothetical protein